MNSELYIADNNKLKFISVVNEDKPYQLLKYDSDKDVNILLPLLGEHQIMNLSVVIKVIDSFKQKKYN